MEKLIRIETIRIIDDYELYSLDIHEDGRISPRGLMKNSHIETYLVIFDKFRILLKKSKQ